MVSISVSHQNASEVEKPRHAIIKTKQVNPFLFSSEYQEILEDFTQWLTRLNYAKHSVKGRTRQLKRFFIFITKNEVLRLEEVRRKHLLAYNEHLHTLPYARQTLEAHIGAIKLYDKLRSAYSLPPIMTTDLKVSKPLNIERSVLTLPEIKALFKACAYDPIGNRDRAMLAIYYGCGLRCNEGVHLEERDINFETGLIHVRRGKAYRERYVPMSKQTKRILKDWIKIYKPLYCIKTNLVLARTDGKMIKNAALNKRLQKLALVSDLDKRATLHLLRHSIATHLSSSGMELESVSQFLGHLHLQTTIKYVHIAESV